MNDVVFRPYRRYAEALLRFSEEVREAENRTKARPLCVGVCSDVVVFTRYLDFLTSNSPGQVRLLCDEGWKRLRERISVYASSASGGRPALFSPRALNPRVSE